MRKRCVSRTRHIVLNVPRFSLAFQRENPEAHQKLHPDCRVVLFLLGVLPHSLSTLPRSSPVVN